MSWSPHIYLLPHTNSPHNLQLSENDLSYVLVVLPSERIDRPWARRAYDQGVVSFCIKEDINVNASVSLTRRLRGLSDSSARWAKKPWLNNQTDDAPCFCSWTSVSNKKYIYEEINSRLNSGNACFSLSQNPLSSRLLLKKVKIK
jgi:hypothetical protein